MRSATNEDALFAESHHVQGFWQTEHRDAGLAPVAWAEMYTVGIKDVGVPMVCITDTPAQLWAGSRRFRRNEFAAYREFAEDGGLTDDEILLDAQSWEIVWSTAPADMGAEGPIYEVWWECPWGNPLSEDDFLTAGSALRGLPVVPVTYGGEPGLSLTDAGRSLQWEIVEAYVRLGFLPPVLMAGLEKESGRGVSQEDRLLVKKCLQSFEIAAARLTERMR